MDTKTLGMVAAAAITVMGAGASVAQAQDRFASWDAMVASSCYHPGSGSDYEIKMFQNASVMGGEGMGNDRMVMAIHGGHEVRTEDLAFEVSNEPIGSLNRFSSRYILDIHVLGGACSVGNVTWQKANVDLHITSPNFDEDVALAAVATRYAVVSVHGFGDKHLQAPSYFPQYAICVGGANAEMRQGFINRVRASSTLSPRIRVIDAVDSPMWDGSQTITATDHCADVDDPLTGTQQTNIVNMGENADGGLQLEMSYSLRRALYGEKVAENKDTPWPTDFATIRAALVDEIQATMAEEDGENFSTPIF